MVLPPQALPYFFRKCYDCHSRHRVGSSSLHWESCRSKNLFTSSVPFSTSHWNQLWFSASVLQSLSASKPQKRQMVQPLWGNLVLIGLQWVGWQFGKDGGHHVSQDLPAVRLQWANLGARAQSENQVLDCKYSMGQNRLGSYREVFMGINVRYVLKGY